jgi:two-component system response regulator GlrR
MHTCAVDADRSRAQPPQPPRVTLFVPAGREGGSAATVAALNTVFDCTVRAAPGAPLAPGTADLAIYEPAAGDAPAEISARAAFIAASCGLMVIVGEGGAAGLDRLIVGEVLDFVQRPFESEELVLRARRALGLVPRSAPPSPRDCGGNLGAVLAGQSEALAREVAKLRRYAACDAGVLIMGETGTGKEVFAQALHYLSARAAHPMVAMNCAAVPPDLMEAELFGHVKGAYTTAHLSRTGLVAEAERGTLFLDDVDCLPLAAQAKLLRFLQEREYRVVGSNAVRHADVRIVAASNRELGVLAQQGLFRQDLFYRLNILSLHLPPLRERREDVGELARHFLRRLSQQYKRPGCCLSAAALGRLLAHDWPGNVRELSHVLERAVLLAGGPVLTAADIDLPGTGGGRPRDEADASFQTVKARVIENFERSYLEGLLTSTSGNIADAARRAGKNRRALFELIRKHQISPAAFKSLAP